MLLLHDLLPWVVEAKCSCWLRQLMHASPSRDLRRTEEPTPDDRTARLRGMRALGFKSGIFEDKNPVCPAQQFKMCIETL